MSSTLKSLIFWIVVLVASQKPCAIMREGEVLLVVNERGDLATGRMTSDTTLVIVKGEHWEPGVTAELKDGGKSLVWRDGSVWKRR